MARLLAWLAVVALAAGCSGRPGAWTSSEPDGRGKAAVPLCALREFGELSARAQMEAIEGRLPELQGCLERAAEAAPVVMVAISREGEVESVLGPGGVLLDTAEGTCVASVIRSLRFPKPSCEMPARLAWRFRADAPPQVLAGDGSCVPAEESSREAIAEVIADHEGDVRLCYERGRALDPRLYGDVAVQFVIDRGGKVAWIGLPQELADPEVGRCIVGALRTWRFPAPCGGIVSGAHVWTFGDRPERKR